MEFGFVEPKEEKRAARILDIRSLFSGYVLTILVFGGYSAIQLYRLGWSGWMEQWGRHVIMPSALILTVQTAVAISLAIDARRSTTKIAGVILAMVSFAGIFAVPIAGMRLLSGH